MPSLSEYIKEIFKSKFRVTQEAEEKDFIQLCQTETEPTMLLPAIHFYGFLLTCIFTKSYLAFKNDATEILYSHVVKPAAANPSSNSTLNQARNGGRHYTSTGSDRN
ncbi:PREDICTED: LOW QUALITY PROTEIN: sclerostin domain-containing protein 1-like, partial [Phaethon lepturus]|uniref:LOW QUALITY PROTEIN: sclerostin domain-containing protein 1-like n=1 Tax=Phaethon lepturus TaxID=97097 RepID=UPI00053056BE